jgi:pimeloyl-ACP methyl ester carboxylesterase
MTDSSRLRGTHVRAADLQGASRLAVEGTLALTLLVENLHHNISRMPGPLGPHSDRPTRGITGLVYRSIRGVTKLVGSGLDTLLGAVARLTSAGDDAAASPERDALLAAMNGVIGDHLAATANPLAIAMSVQHGGRALGLERASLAAAIPGAGGRVLLMVHGLCMSPRQWRRNGSDHGAIIAAEGGFTLLYLHYNTGLHVSENGRLLADRLEALQREWPVRLDELVIVGHSMGGLVARSACHQGRERGHAWPGRLTKMVFLGTPHHGAPLERGGHWIDTVLGASPYTAAFARLGKLRSAGITDLRHGNVIEADHAGADRFAPRRDLRTPVPLPAGVQCFAIAASRGRPNAAPGQRLPGDGLVPVDSALGRHRLAARRLDFDAQRQWVGQGMNHLGLLHRDEVLAQLRAWLLDPAASSAPAAAQQ